MASAGPRKIVVDANRALSALLRDGPTRRIFLETKAALFAPEVMRGEVQKHLASLTTRAGLSRESLEELFDLLTERIEWVEASAYAVHLSSAGAAMESTDPLDTPFLACALAVGADAIWSFDLDFDRQTLVPRIPHPDAEIP